MIIEYCIKNIKISTGNCVILEGTGDLDHYSCVEKFNSSCPLEFYSDEEIYKCEWRLLYEYKEYSSSNTFKL